MNFAAGFNPLQQPERADLPVHGNGYIGPEVIAFQEALLNAGKDTLQVVQDFAYARPFDLELAPPACQFLKQRRNMDCNHIYDCLEFRL